VFFQDDRRLYRVTALDGIPWLEYGFCTRHSVRWPKPWKLATLRQIHSATAVVVDEPPNADATGDALITDTPGLLVGVRTADCLPILLVEERRRVVAAVHAGWRGTLAGVVSTAIARMTEVFGADPAWIHAAIGPGIGPCCFVVGEEVADRFRQTFPERADLDGRTSLDLSEANRRQLLRAGIQEDHVYAGAPCNCCRPEEFHSHRRSPGGTDRMISVAGIRP